MAPNLETKEENREAITTQLLPIAVYDSEFVPEVGKAPLFQQLINGELPGD